MRKQFSLPDFDMKYLNSTGLSWETIIERGVRWLTMHDFPVPIGYNHHFVRVAVRIENGYPDAQLDMVYFYPPLSRCDGKTINALSQQSLDGFNWQRWSRHRTPQNPWCPGQDSLETHILLVTYWLEREFMEKVA